MWEFFQKEILGMAWLNRLVGTVLNALGLDTGGKIGASVQFFIYDMIKIMVLLGIFIAVCVVGIISAGYFFSAFERFLL